MNYEKYAKLAKKCSVFAGKHLKSNYSNDVGLLSNAGKDIKTHADLDAEKIILSELESTNIPILSEESSTSSRDNLNVFDAFESQSMFWIIDPLDGTYNFFRGLPFCCISISLWRGSSPIIGVIYDFLRDCIFHSIIGGGAFCNGEKLSVSKNTEISKSCLATGFPSSRDYCESSIYKTIKLVQEFKKVRMIGSAASSLALVAQGKVDSYFEEKIWLWDVAAGLAIIDEAGGTFKISEINSSWQLNVSANNGSLEHFF